jgi:hypothetical protein
VTQPPPPGPWDPQQPGQWPQGPGYPGGPGQYGPPQQQWPVPVPPKKGGAGKWILGAVALVAVIAVTAAVAVSCTKSGGNSASGGGTSAAPNNSGIASANDTGPVGIITEDPSCAPWGPVATTLSNAESNGWDKRDSSIPASSWTPEQQSQYQAVAQAMRSAADQTVPLAKLTTHRVMRELYEQFIAYSRAYADSIPAYVSIDDNLAKTTIAAGTVLNSICSAIAYSSAAAREPLVPATSAPQQIAPVGDPANPQKFMANADPNCVDWKKTIDQLNADPIYLQWNQGDGNIPASSWNDQYKADNQAVVPVLSRFANSYENLGRESSNPFIADIGALSAQYGRAFVVAIPTYTQSDSYIYNVFAQAPGIVNRACAAVGAD